VSSAMANNVTPVCRPRRVLVLGATGTIGRATVAALSRHGHEVVCLVRPRSGNGRTESGDDLQNAGVTLRFGEASNPHSLRRDGFCGESFDAIVSCLASRTGAPEDAWCVDYGANLEALAAGFEAGVSQMVLVSAICVQKPRLAFQHAKLAFEKALIDSGMRYSIVRPTAFFKSLSGQIERVRRGKPYLVFGDGRRTASKPISDADLAEYLARCLEDESKHNKILPVGGPGPAVTPREQGEHLFALFGREPRFRGVPLGLLHTVARAFDVSSRFVPPLAAKAELARIARYYATESMLVLDPDTGLYDADATPSFGTESLFDYYERVARGHAAVERGAHTVFERRDAR